MTFKTFLRTGGSAAIAAAIALSASPAFAQSHGRWREARSEQSNDNGASQAARVERAERRAQPQRPQSAPPQQQRTWQSQPAPAAQQAPQAQQQAWGNRGGWNRGDNRSPTGAERQGRDWNRRDNTSNDWGQARAAQAQAQAQAQARARVESEQRSQQWQRNGTYADGQRNQTYRSGYRDGRQSDWRQDRQQTQSGYRSGNRDGQRWDGQRWVGQRDGRGYDGRQGNYQRWSNDWRRDSRYNWSSYRNANRSVFHVGRYYAPYQNYRYSRIGIGFRLDDVFFGSRYLINDPWQYRLPPAYGPYRWVRYYDDALLVDTYSGQVVDVIYDFFW